MKKLFLIFLIGFPTNNIAIQTLTEHDIRKIYINYVKPNMNNKEMLRYEYLPLEKNNNFWPWENKDLPRVIALLEFERFIIENNIFCEKGLAINGLDPEWHYLPAQIVAQIYYEKNPEEYDLHTLDLPDKDFDFIMANQTLEHVYDPIRCLESIYNHMRPGGILYFNAPANTIPHDTPLHYYNGFTSVGVGAMVKAAGFRILRIGQWGNSEYLQIMHKTNYWPDYQQFTGPTINDMKYSALIVWVFAIK